MIDSADSLLRCENVTVTVPGRTLVEDLDLDLFPGNFVVVLGRNGVGKSLTMHTLAGLRTVEAGRVELHGASLDMIGRRDIARQLALLPQDADDAFPATVLETVLIGRHPHIHPFNRESASDRQIACDALRQVGLEAFSRRDIATLSGGERRRVAVAQVLTQSPGIFLLDEPSNHLDPQHQLEVLQIFRDRAQNGATIVASLHDVNLAARFATHCLLLYGDGRWALGKTPEILDVQRLSELYATPMEMVPWRSRQLFVATGLTGQPD